MKIIIDADACPKTVLKICTRAARDYGVPLHTVSSFNHNIVSDHHTMVGNGSQETDMAVINMTAAEDIVVTHDWGLAALVLGKGAAAIAPSGKIFRLGTIDFLLEEREAKAKLRRGGHRIRGPRRRTAEDDARFAANLHKLIEERVHSLDG